MLPEALQDAHSGIDGLCMAGCRPIPPGCRFPTAQAPAKYSLLVIELFPRLAHLRGLETSIVTSPRSVHRGVSVRRPTT